MGKYTLDDVKAMQRETLTPAIVGSVLGCDPYSLTLMARQRPEMIKFPFQIVGNRTKFPRLAFIRFMEGTQDKDDKKEIIMEE